MTQIEDNALWIKQQKARIYRKVQKLNVILVGELVSNRKPVYFLSLRFSSIGRYMSFYITELDKSEKYKTNMIKVMETTGLSDIFENIVVLNDDAKREITTKIDYQLRIISLMIKVARKYVKLNEKLAQPRAKQLIEPTLF